MNARPQRDPGRNGQSHHHTTQLRRHASMTEALGPEIAGALADPSVTDILLNADGVLWGVKQGVGFYKLGHLTPQRAESVIRLLASHMGAEVSATRPTVSGVIPGTDDRFEGVVPPASRQPVFAIRRHPNIVRALDDFVRDGVVSQDGVGVIRSAIENRLNLLITGGTGSGKTTFANACLAEPAFCQDRVVLIEDTRELRCSAENRLELVAAPLATGHAIDHLVRTTLRLFPSRIVIGEVRGREALSMVKAWGTGHPGGLCTMHANNARHAMYRLEELVGEAAATIPRRTIASAIGLIIHIERDDNTTAGRRVASMTRPSLADNGAYAFEDVSCKPAGAMPPRTTNETKENL